MLDGVRHAGHAILIAEVANVDIESGASLVRLRVVNQQRLEVVFEADNTVLAVVERRLLQAVCQQHGGGLATRGQPRQLRGRHCEVAGNGQAGKERGRREGEADACCNGCGGGKWRRRRRGGGGGVGNGKATTTSRGLVVRLCRRRRPPPEGACCSRTGAGGGGGGKPP